MSRNRPRPRDNGFGNNEELELWTKICQDIRKSKDKFDQQTTLSLQIKALVDKITNDGNSEYILTPRVLIPRSIPHQAPISAP
jgi:SAGA-associated factor 29